MYPRFRIRHTEINILKMELYNFLNKVCNKQNRKIILKINK